MGSDSDALELNIYATDLSLWVEFHVNGTFESALRWKPTIMMSFLLTVSRGSNLTQNLLYSYYMHTGITILQLWARGLLHIIVPRWWLLPCHNNQIESYDSSACYMRMTDTTHWMRTKIRTIKSRSSPFSNFTTNGTLHDSWLTWSHQH